MPNITVSANACEFQKKADHAGGDLMAENSRLSHMDEEGAPRMVDVGQKRSTVRRAVAAGDLLVSDAVIEILRRGPTRKGDPLAVARIAAIQGAKKTADLVPLCHPVPLDHVVVQCELFENEKRIQMRAEACATARTGVEMEALAAVSIGLLTLYDMLKSADKSMRISNIRLLEKQGGLSGHFRAATE
jgi:cyclic pyranopterin monophosphate synthase